MFAEGGVLRSIVLFLTIILLATTTTFASVTVTKDWNDGLTGTNANNRAAPSVNLTGETPYEQLLNLFYPVNCYFETTDSSFNPNTAWGGTWVKENDTSTSNIMSNNEIPIGTWTNGKTIYRKVIHVADAKSYSQGFSTKSNEGIPHLCRWREEFVLKT